MTNQKLFLLGSTIVICVGACFVDSNGDLALDPGAIGDGIFNNDDSSENGDQGSTGVLSGDCCPDGDCLCHGHVPLTLTAANGPFRTRNERILTGTLFYPTDADAPFAAVAITPGFLNTGPEMNSWGTFFASWGIVTVVTTVGGGDLPNIRANKLLDSIDELKALNLTPGSSLFSKLAGRYGVSGYSMGGGGATIASVSDPTLRTSVGLAAWAPAVIGIRVPTLLICGGADVVAPCIGNSENSYASIAAPTPKMLLVVTGAGHLAWFTPSGAGLGTSGQYALAFQKVFLEGDTRWKSLLLSNQGMVQKIDHEYIQ